MTNAHSITLSIVAGAILSGGIPTALGSDCDIQVLHAETIRLDFNVRSVAFLQEAGSDEHELHDECTREFTKHLVAPDGGFSYGDVVCDSSVYANYEEEGDEYYAGAQCMSSMWGRRGADFIDTTVFSDVNVYWDLGGPHTTGSYGHAVLAITHEFELTEDLSYTFNNLVMDHSIEYATVELVNLDFNIAVDLTHDSFADPADARPISAGRYALRIELGYFAYGNAAYPSVQSIDSIMLKFHCPWFTRPGDFNKDGKVNGLDLAQLIGAWGTYDELTDINGDGKVDGEDLAKLLSNWG